MSSSKKIKEAAPNNAVINNLPIDLFTTKILPFLNGMDVYCLHMTCKRFRGIYKHMTPLYRSLPYPMWPMVQNKWCPMCDKPCKRELVPGDNFHGHTSCSKSFEDNAIWVVGPEGDLDNVSNLSSTNRGNSVCVVGPLYNGLYFNSRFTAENTLGHLVEEKDVFTKTFQSDLEEAISFVAHSERVKFLDSKFAGRKGQIKIAPGAYKNYYRRVRECNYTVDQINDYLRRLQVLMDGLYEWYKQNVRPKFIWETRADWTVTLGNIDPTLRHYFDKLVEWDEGHVSEIKQKVTKGLPLYISRRLPSAIAGIAYARGSAIRCSCDGCIYLISDLHTYFSSILRGDSVSMGADRGVSDVLKFGCLPRKSSEIHRQFANKCAKMFIAVYQILRLHHAKFTDTTRIRALLAMGLKYVQSDCDIDAMQDELMTALDKYDFDTVATSFQNGGPTHIMQTCREYRQL